MEITGPVATVDCIKPNQAHNYINVKSMFKYSQQVLDAGFGSEHVIVITHNDHVSSGCLDGSVSPGTQALVKGPLNPLNIRMRPYLLSDLRHLRFRVLERIVRDDN
jgi:hypothetical protein